MSHQWTKLSKQKYIKNIQIDDLSKEINQENLFGSQFYHRLYEILNRNNINFDICNKLIARDTSGTSNKSKQTLFKIKSIFLSYFSCF